MTAGRVRVLVAVREEAIRERVTRCLREAQDLVLEAAESQEQAAAALGRGDAEAVVLEMPLSPAVRALHGNGDAARPVPIVLLTRREAVPPDPDLEGLPCLEPLPADELSPALLRRTLLYAVERCRAEARRLQAEKALKESEGRYRSLFEQSRDAIFMTEAGGRVLEVNQAALDLLGCSRDDLLGEDVLTIYPDPADRDRFRQEIATRGHVRDFDVRLRRQDGAERWCLVSAWVRQDPDGGIRGYQGIIHDITARKEVERQLAHEAFHDGLTGLPNRALFMDRLERAVARRRRGEERQVGVLFLDMDRFKVVNDSLGHLAGDQLLQEVGRVLSEQVREEDTVARIGGDEFAILLDGVDDPAHSTHVAERVQERLRTPFHIQGHDVFTSVSIGITFGGAEVERAEDLLRDADTAMYRAKELGPARYQIFDERMHAHAVTLLQLETDLRLALERREFVLHYQPLVDLRDRQLQGFEALIRWNHPRKGLLQPQAFVPVAEDTGLIVPMGEWVIRTATRQLRLWQERNPRQQGLVMSINVAKRQLSYPGLADLIRDVLLETGLTGESLRLELTESVLTRHSETTLATLRALRGMGISLCIDDFGTGYSSLHHLHQFPVDSLKIDRSFVGRLEDGGGRHLVATIIALARHLGIRTIAEGVETNQQLEILRELGSGSVQGFLLSAPLDQEAAGSFLDEIPLGAPPSADS